MTTYPLDTVCDVIKMHPQTVWTALGLDTDYGLWTRNKNPDIEFDAVAFAYGISESIFKRCLLKNDEILDTRELEKLLKLPAEVLRRRHYPILIRKKHNVRYLRSAVMERHSQRYLNDKLRADGKRPARRKKK
jgi:hypothetical protein